MGHFLERLSSIGCDVKLQRLRIGRLEPASGVKAVQIRCTGTDAEEELAFITLDQRIPGISAVFGFKERTFKPYENMIRTLFAKSNFFDCRWVIDKIILAPLPRFPWRRQD